MFLPVFSQSYACFVLTVERSSVSRMDDLSALSLNKWPLNPTRSQLLRMLQAAQATALSDGAISGAEAQALILAILNELEKHNSE
jgi:hypothetical protein